MKSTKHIGKTDFLRYFPYFFTLWLCHNNLIWSFGSLLTIWCYQQHFLCPARYWEVVRKNDGVFGKILLYQKISTSRQNAFNYLYWWHRSRRPVLIEIRAKALCIETGTRYKQAKFMSQSWSKATGWISLRASCFLVKLSRPQKLAQVAFVVWLE